MSFYLSLFIISSLLVFAGLFINQIQKIYLSEPLLAMILGILCSSIFLDILDMPDMKEPEKFMQNATKLTIGLSLVSATLSLPRNYLKQYARDQSLILTVVMLLMWISSSLIIYLLFGISFKIALLAGAVITPTDPVVSSAIISGKYAEKYLSQGFRDSISFESAANDGLGYPILIFCLFILGYGEAESWSDWFVKVVLWENVASLIIGVFAGYLLGKLLFYADGKGYMIPKTVLPFTIACTFLLLSFLELIHCNSIIGVFGFGMMLNRKLSEKERLQEEKIQESMERLFTIPIYFIFGLFLPFKDWMALGWPLLIAFGILILFFRRIPAMILIKPFLKHFNDLKDVSLLGWYGPIGVAAIFYSMHVIHSTPYRKVWILCSFAVFMSTIVHGISSLPLAHWYYHAKQKQG